MSIIETTRTASAVRHVSGFYLSAIAMERSINREIDRIENDTGGVVVGVSHTILSDGGHWSAIITYRFTVTTREETNGQA